MSGRYQFWCDDWKAPEVLNEMINECFGRCRFQSHESLHFLDNMGKSP